MRQSKQESPSVPNVQSGPFVGLRVVELGRFIAAPYCGQLLADGGADVVKIEPLRGDDSRRNGTRLGPTEARQYLNKNRGKRSLSVNLSDERVQSIVATLLKDADIAIANFRPGLAEKLKLDYESVRSTNKRIIYAQNTAFGTKGKLANQPGMDALIQAYAGLGVRSENGFVPFSEPIVDYTAALLMSWGIATALYVRERTGEGQKLDVSLLQAALVIQNNSMNHIDKVDRWRNEFVEYLTTAFRQGASLHEVLSRKEIMKPSINPPYYGFFETANGQIAIGAGGHGLRVQVAKLLEVEDPTLVDSEFVPDDVQEFTRELRTKTAAAIKRKTTEYWMEKFADAGVPVGAVQLREQVLDDEHVWANEYLVRMKHETLGSMTCVAPPVKFGDTPLRVTTAPPLLGRDTTEILSELGVSNAEIAKLREDGAIVVHESHNA